MTLGKRNQQRRDLSEGGFEENLLRMGQMCASKFLGRNLPALEMKPRKPLEESSLVKIPV